MSPRAAWRLETLGFEHVYEYAAGEADWGAAGLPLEGEVAGIPTIGGKARTDVPTVRLDERIGELRSRTLDVGWNTAMVVNEKNVLLGRLYRQQLEGDPQARVEDVMKPGPSTFRPNVSIPEMVEFMHMHDLDTAPVTTSSGVLVGIIFLKDAERVLAEMQ